MTVWYTQNMEIQEMSEQGVTNQVTAEVNKAASQKRGRPKKNQANNDTTQGENQMNEETVNTNETVVDGNKPKRIQRTVFDVAGFKDITLYKDVTLPAKPADLKEALALLDNNTDRAVELIYKGMVSDATSKAWDQIEGFGTLDEEDNIEPYTGRFADESMTKKINAAVLTLAKLQGYTKDLSPEKKNELKEKAAAFIRSNPAMLQSL